MSTETAQKQEELKPRGNKRIAFEAKVNLEFEKFSGFISEYSHNISEGGMFVRTTAPQPIGSVFSFEFRLRDDVKLIQGWGEVVWVREGAEVNAEHPAGMGVKFIDLDPESRLLIRRIVQTEKAMDKNKQPGIENLLDDVSHLIDESSEAATDNVASASPGTLEDQLPTEVIGPKTAEPAAGDESLLDSSDEVAESGEESSGTPWLKYSVLGVVLLSLAATGWLFRSTVVSLAMTVLFTFGLLKPQQNDAVKVNETPVVSTTPTVSPTNSEAQSSTPDSASTAPAPTPAPIIATTPAAPPVVPPSVLKPATQLLQVVNKSSATGGLFEIQLDGTISSGQANLFQTTEVPVRVVLDINGISQSYTKAPLKVTDSRVQQIRFGVYQNPDKLRLVFDLQPQFKGSSSLKQEGQNLLVEIR